MPAIMRAMWDVFCRVIDNHGDLGVCLRLSRQLAARGVAVRLWVDDASALSWMAPELASGQMPGVQWRPWSQASESGVLAELSPASVWVEAFGCELPEAFVAHGVAQSHALGRSQPAWINLEYLSAEPWVERAHGLPSPVMNGPARGWVKRFFYPGFTERTGGLLREHDLQAQQSSFDRTEERARRLAQAQDLDPQAAQATWVSLFCYEPAGLPALLSDWPAHARLWVTPGRAMAAVRAACVHLPSADPIDPTLKPDLWPAFAHPLAYTPQAEFDRLLWACDLNLVRGEDSLVRALWAGQPLVWHIYPQADHAHHVKLEAFLNWLDAPASLRRFTQVWNGLATGPLPHLSAGLLAEWAACVASARQRLLAQADLLTQLERMVCRWPLPPAAGSGQA